MSAKQEATTTYGKPARKLLHLPMLRQYFPSKLIPIVVPDIILSVVLWIQQELLTESRPVPNTALRDQNRLNNPAWFQMYHRLQTNLVLGFDYHTLCA